MTDRVQSASNQGELNPEERRLKRIKELQDSLSKLAQDSPERKVFEDELQTLEGTHKGDDAEQPEKPENEVSSNMANLFANQEDLPRVADTPTRPNPNANSQASSAQSDVDPAEQARLKAENERRMREFRERTINESEDIEMTKDDVESFVDWCLGGNRFLGYDEGKGNENTNKMASQLTSVIFTRLGGTGIGMALISTGVLSWLGIIIIAWSNTPNCVMDKLKETLGDSMFGIIPLDKIPNITDKLADYAEGTTARVQAEVDRIKKGKERRREILSAQSPSEAGKNTPAVPRPTLPKQSVNAQSVQPKTASKQTAPVSSIQSSEKPAPSVAPQKPIPNDEASRSVVAGKNGTTQEAPQKPSSSSRQENSPVAGNAPRFTKTIPPVDPVRKRLSPESIANDGQNACMVH